MKHFTIGRMGLALLAMAVVCLGQIAVASAQGGSDNAKLCQDFGWMTHLRSSNGTPFADEGACVRYTTQGGTLIETNSRADCLLFGGTFSFSPATDRTGFVQPADKFVWSCNGYANPVNSQLASEDLGFDCIEDVAARHVREGQLSEVGRNPIDGSCFLHG